jgi:hypothetical protein
VRRAGRKVFWGTGIASGGLVVQDRVFEGLDIASPYETLLTVAAFVGFVGAVLTSDPVVHRIPYAVVRKTERALAAQSDEELIGETFAEVSRLGVLFGQHARYSPSRMPRAGATREEIDRDLEDGAERSRQHEQATVGRFFDDHYRSVMTLSAALYERGSLTDEELRHLNWIIATASAVGHTHNLGDIGATLAKAAQRLRAGGLPKDDSR